MFRGVYKSMTPYSLSQSSKIRRDDEIVEVLEPI